MITYEIMPAERSHILAMALALRAGDRAELEATGFKPRRILLRSWEGSIWSRAAFVDGELAAVWGVSGCPLGTHGLPWLLTAPPIERAKLAFLAEARAAVAQMLLLFPQLRGYVDARYHGAIRLLGALGFEVGPEFAYGSRGAPFREYSIVRAAARQQRAA